MESLITLLTEYKLVDVLIIIILFLLACREAYAMYIWVKNRLDGYHASKNQEEKKEETIEERIARLERLSTVVDNIDHRIMSLEERQRRQTVCTTRSILNSMYRDADEHGYLTQAEYETYANIRDLYLECGGNHYFAEYVIPKMNTIPIKDGGDTNA